MSPPRRRLAAGRVWWRGSLGGRGIRRMRELDLDTHVLALCAQQVLCTAPLIVAISAVLQRVTGRNVSFVISRFFGLHDKSEDAVSKLFGRASLTISTLALVLGLITAVVFTASVAAVQQRAFERIWTLPRVSGMKAYWRQLLWAPALAVYSVTLLLAGKAGRWLDHHVLAIGSWSVLLMQGVTTLFFFWWTQHFLLRGRVEWRALWPGALAVGVLTSIVVRLSRVIMPPQIEWQVKAYGLIGAVFVLSVWLMVVSTVIFVGTLLGALLAEKRANPKRKPPHESEASHSPLTKKGLDSAADSQEIPVAR